MRREHAPGRMPVRSWCLESFPKIGAARRVRAVRAVRELTDAFTPREQGAAGCVGASRSAAPDLRNSSGLTVVDLEPTWSDRAVTRTESLDNETVTSGHEKAIDIIAVPTGPMTTG